MTNSQERAELSVEEALAHARFLHMTDEEIDRWFGGKLKEVELVRVRAHLDRCLLCETRIKRTSSASLGKIDLALAAAPPRPGRRGRYYKGQTQDGSLVYVVAGSIEEADHSVTVSISSRKLGRQGALVDLSGGRFSRRLKLEPLARDQVGAEAVLSPVDREHLGSEEIVMTLLPPGGGDGPEE